MKKWTKEEDGETRIAMDSTFYLGSKSASARDDWSAVDIRVSTLERARSARVFFLTAKNEWINWAIINYPIIASEQKNWHFPTQKIKKISSANLKKCFIKNEEEEPSGSPVYYLGWKTGWKPPSPLHKWYWTFTFDDCWCWVLCLYYIYTNDDSTTNPILYSMVTQLTPKYTLSEIRPLFVFFIYF